MNYARIVFIKFKKDYNLLCISRVKEGFMRKIKVNLIFKPGIPSARKKGGGDQTSCKMLYNALNKRDDVEAFFNAKLKDGPFDIIHFHSLGDVFWKFVEDYSNRIIYTAHVIPETMVGSAILADKWKPILTQYLLFFYNQARVVIAVSPYEKKILEEIGVKTKIVYIPNGIDIEKFKPIPEIRRKMREEFNLNKNDIAILSVGHVIKRKGFDTFVKTAMALPKYKFFWIGGIPFSILSSGYSEAKKILENPPKNLYFLGPHPHDELPKFYNMADIFFFPSRQENFSIAVLEAASCGLPLILRNLEEYIEPFSPNYISFDNEEDAIEKVEKLCEDAKLREEYSKKSIGIAHKYDINRVAEETVKVYKEVILEE
jgi:1,2-diacylglycerol-3-alpha-glucose alpha-1,2-galactosyltransferase